MLSLLLFVSLLSSHFQLLILAIDVGADMWPAISMAFEV
jgi:hypothetical protein